jgi:hypothetical protein
MQTQHHCIQGTLASKDFAICRNQAPGVQKDGCVSKSGSILGSGIRINVSFWRDTIFPQRMLFLEVAGRTHRRGDLRVRQKQHRYLQGQASGHSISFPPFLGQRNQERLQRDCHDTELPCGRLTPRSTVLGQRDTNMAFPSQIKVAE